MPVCAICDGEIFDCTDGLYYCQICGTQSQDIRDEEAVDDEVDGRLQVKKQGKRGVKQRFFADKGKPWFMYEAYQHIIKAQVEFLITIGVNPALKDVVFKLWYKYLQVTGNAFTGSQEGAVPITGSIFYRRHADLLGVNKRKSNRAKKKADPFDDNDNELELCSHFSDEEFYEDDDPSKAQQKDNNNAIVDDDDINLGDDWTAFSDKNSKPVEDVPANEDSSDSSEDEFVGSVTLNRSKKRNKIHSGHMTLHGTLAFCYLGLLWMDEPIFVSDLIRWAKQGQLPYCQATMHIPRHMKFGQNDFFNLCPKDLPRVSTILQLASRIAKLLRLPCFPEAKWSTYTARFITDLHLPGFFHGVVRNLTENVKVKMTFDPSKEGHSNCIPNFEAGAMAFIVVALKLCYGIDDSTEKKQEAMAVPTETRSDPKSRDTIPLFTDWLKSIKRCEAKTFKDGVPWTDEQFKLVQNPTAYTAFCESDIFGSWEPKDQVYTGSKVKNLRASRITNKESQEKYAQLFKSLMSREQEEEFDSVATPQVSSFPATCAHVHENDMGTANCFEQMRSRGIKKEELFGGDPLSRESELKYVSYSTNSVYKSSFHSSYEALLNIVANRIEMKPKEVQSKIEKLENVLFSDQSYLYKGIL